MKIARSAGLRFGIPAAAVACISTGIFVIGTIPAEAATVGPQSITVSCNPANIATGPTVVQSSTGDFKVKQDSSSPVEATRVWARDQEGNTLKSKTITDGETATWTSVLPAQYTVRAVISSAQNCNGIGIGDGNYTWKFTVTFTG
jgi:hypothetical protein